MKKAILETRIVSGLFLMALGPLENLTLRRLRALNLLNMAGGRLEERMIPKQGLSVDSVPCGCVRAEVEESRGPRWIWRNWSSVLRVSFCEVNEDLVETEP